MTIFNTGYSSLDYQPVSGLARFWPLIRAEFLQIFRTKKGVLVFILCVAFVLVKGLVLFFRLAPESEQMAQLMQGIERFSPGLNAMRPEFYIQHAATDWSWLPLLLLTSLVSVRSIAADRAANALEIYWTRGITPWGYFFGKWMGSALLLAAAFLAGPLVLWLYGLLAAPDGTYFERTIAFMPQVLLALTILCLTISFLAVGFSAMSQSPNVAMFVWLLMIGGSKALGEILYDLSSEQMRYEIYEPPWYHALCPIEAINRIQADLAGLPPGPSDFDQIWIAWAIMGGYAAFLGVRLRFFLRTTEAVG